MDRGDVVDALAQLSWHVQSSMGDAAAARGVSVSQLRLLGILRDREPEMLALARYLRLDKDSTAPWSTTLRLVTGHDPGALHAAIEPFRYHQVNMTSLHSRPIMGEPWRYQFYIEIDGHRSDAKVRGALRDVGDRSAFLETLGSYPVWRDPS